MAAPDSARPAPSRVEASWPELGFILLVLLVGFYFLRDAAYWGRSTYVGTAQFGDAEFWWNGALHFSRGIIAENPNITFRMGYATFAGCFVAVFGPDYHLFHTILITLFLVTVSGLYLSLRGLIGRISAGAAIIFFVFNPYTAEWLAISTSDSLGLMLNLAALLALVAGVRDGLRLRWIALFGLFFASASLTRPLMTPFVLPGLLAVLATGWPDRRRTARALAVLLASFFAPTLVWMGAMALTTGNFALTGDNQDSSTFYSVSDPQIQTWRAEMYDPVNAAAKKHFQTKAPTSRQLNQEFWRMTRANYIKHWNYHLKRVAHNLTTLAQFTPDQSTLHTPLSAQWRLRLKWLLALALCCYAFRQQRQWTAILLLALGWLWTLQPAATPWLIWGAGVAGLVALAVRRPGIFLWATYWWVGTAALYLTGGTWEPPVAPAAEMTALGYRLGFQFLFLNDFLVIGLLGCIALGRTPGGTLEDNTSRIFVSSATAGRLLHRSAVVFFTLLFGVLLAGASIVGWRVYSRSHSPTVPYPDPSGLVQTNVARGAKVLGGLASVRDALNLPNGRPVLMTGTSSGFIWNLTGQQRSMLLLYQQDNLQPVQLSPRHLYVELSRHLRERQWMNRPGAWVLRVFPDIAPLNSLPYYYEMPAIAAFVPLAADGKSYDLARAVVFPIAKYATQLVAAGDLVFSGAKPSWAPNSGALMFPRRFGLQGSAEGRDLAWDLNLQHVRGKRSLRFSLELEETDGEPVHVRLESSQGEALWEADLIPGSDPVPVQPILPDTTPGLRLTIKNLRPGRTLWFYELVLEADDFTQ